MPGDRHELAALCHDVSERGQMSIVDVDTVTVENESELVDQALSRSLDAQHLLDFQTVIGLRSSVIDLVDRQDSTQAHAIRFNDPVIVGLDELSSDGIVVTLNVLGEGDFRDLNKAFDDHVFEDAFEELFEEASVLLWILFLQACNPDPNHLALCILIRVHHADLLSKHLMKHLVDGRDGQVLLYHPLVIKLKSDDPWAITAILGLVLQRWYLIVERDKLLVRLDDGLLWIWIVEDLRAADNMLQCRVLDLSADVRDDFLVLSVPILEEDLQ